MFRLLTIFDEMGSIALFFIRAIYITILSNSAGGSVQIAAISKPQYHSNSNPAKIVIIHYI